MAEQVYTLSEQEAWLRKVAEGFGPSRRDPLLEAADTIAALSRQGAEGREELTGLLERAQHLLSAVLHRSAADTYDLDRVSEAFNDITKGLAALRAEPQERRDLDDAKSAYMNLRTCKCGRDADDHPGLNGSNEPNGCDGFDPDWEAVRKSMEARQVEGPPQERKPVEERPRPGEEVYIAGMEWEGYDSIAEVLGPTGEKDMKGRTLWLVTLADADGRYIVSMEDPDWAGMEATPEDEADPTQIDLLAPPADTDGEDFASSIGGGTIETCPACHGDGGYCSLCAPTGHTGEGT